jgi:hypothetical protein
MSQLTETVVVFFSLLIWALVNLALMKRRRSTSQTDPFLGNWGGNTRRQRCKMTMKRGEGEIRYVLYQKSQKDAYLFIYLLELPGSPATLIWCYVQAFPRL